MPAEAAAEADGSSSAFEHCKVDSKRRCCRDEDRRLALEAPFRPSLGGGVAPIATGSASSTWFFCSGTRS